MRAYSLGLYEKSMPSEMTWREKLQIAKETGYDYVEISIDETEEKIRRLNMSKQERFELISSMYKIGLPIRSTCVSALTKYSLGNDDKELCTRGMKILEKAIELADDLGIRVVMIPGYDVYYAPSNINTKRRYLNNLKKGTEMAEKAGIILGLETMENEFMNTVGKAMKYVVLCNSNYLKIYPDIGNLTNAAVQYKSDVLEDLELGRGNITSLHLKETIPGKYREVPYGTGHVDFEKAIETSWKMGVRRYVTEFWYIGSERWKDDLIFANHMMTEILDRQT